MKIFAAGTVSPLPFHQSLRGGGKISRQIKRRAANFITAIRTDNRAVCFRRKICGDDLAGEFSVGTKHGKTVRQF